MLNVILLAAGQGQRMGGPNKLLLPFRGATVLETTLEQLHATGLGPIYVVTGHERTALAPLLARFPVREIYHPGYAAGMTGSIRAGVGAATDGWGYMIGLADMPLISTAAYSLLADRFRTIAEQDERALLLPRFGTAKGNPVIFAAHYRDEILRHPAPEGCRGILEAHPEHIYWVDMPDNGVLLDLDTPEDYRSF